MYPRSYVGLETRGRARYLGSALETSPSWEQGLINLRVPHTWPGGTARGNYKSNMITRTTYDRCHPPYIYILLDQLYIVFSSGELSKPFVTCVTPYVFRETLRGLLQGKKEKEKKCNVSSYYV